MTKHLKHLLLLLFFSVAILGCNGGGSQESSDRQKFKRACEDIILLADDAIYYRIKSGGEFYDRLDSIALNVGYLASSIPEARDLQQGLNSFSTIYQEQYGRNSAPTALGLVPLDFLIERDCGMTYFGD